MAVLLLAVACVASAANPSSELRVKQAKKFEAKIDGKGLLSYSKNWTEKYPKYALAWYYLGHAYELLGQSANAINAEHRALRLAGQNHLLEARIWAMIGETYGNADKHEKSMSAALRVIPYEKTLIKAGAWYSLGLTYELFGLNSKTINAYTQALVRSPQSALLWANLGSAYSEAKEYSKAISALQHAARLAPNSTKVWKNLTAVYLQAKEYSKAITALQHAARLAPNSAKVWDELGVLYGHAEDYTKAIKAFQTAVNIDPNDRIAHHYLPIARSALAMNIENNKPARQAGQNSKAITGSPRSPALKYSSVSCTRDILGYVVVNGEVKNVSNETYSPEITGKFSTASGALVTSDMTYPQYQPLMPGQTSTFQLSNSPNPDIASVDLGAADQTESHSDYDAKIPTIGQKHATCN